MEPHELQARLTDLLVEHRELDEVIVSLAASGNGDQVEVARLKKRKLRLKDEMAMIHDQLVPDIIA
jgi:hypothetical protein